MEEAPTVDVATDVVRYEVHNSVTLITMNRPEKRNALSHELREGLRRAWFRFEEDSHARVAILTGAGDQAFCAGMDLKEASATRLRIPPRAMIPVLGDNLKVSKPTIAAVNGAAIAGGWLMAQMCDLCISVEDAVFSITEAKIGRGTPWAAPLIQMLPQRVCMEILLTGEPIRAQRLYELGYVNRVVPREALRKEAMALALRIAANAPLTVKACRDLIYQSAGMGRAAGLDAAHRLFDHVYLSEDAQEGPRSFAEKRPPIWRGI